MASFSASPASSIISLVPLVRCLRAAHASSLTEPAPNRESSVSFAASQVVSASSPARMLLPVAPIKSWHQAILALSASTSPSWNLCSNSYNQSDNSCCLWSYLVIALIMEFILAFVVSYFSIYNFLCLVLFYFKFFSNVHPNPAIHRLATTVKRVRLLPGVKTLFRDSEEAYPWCL